MGEVMDWIAFATICNSGAIMLLAFTLMNIGRNMR